MTRPAFDTLKYSQRLKAIGMSEKQAVAQAEALSEVLADLCDTLVTKSDLEGEVQRVEGKIEGLAARMDASFKSLGEHIAAKFNNFDDRFSARLAGSEERLKAELGSSADRLNARMDSTFAEVKSGQRLHSWMLGVLVLTELVPLFRDGF